MLPDPPPTPAFWAELPPRPPLLLLAPAFGGLTPCGASPPADDAVWGAFPPWYRCFSDGLILALAVAMFTGPSDPPFAGPFAVGAGSTLAATSILKKYPLINGDGGEGGEG